MNKIASLPTIAGALLAFGLSAAPAQAQANRTFVSGTGTDAGACTRPAPCRSFAFAITQTAAGGEIDVLDPASYGQVGITKAISIVNDGVGVAAIGASSGNGITIAAGVGDSVHLRGLTIDGLGGGKNGIQFNSGLSLAIENCVIRNFTNDGINISPSTSSSFSVSNTIASNNVGGNGIQIAPTGSAIVTGVLSRVTANNNNDGILVVGGPQTGASLNVTIVDSVASKNRFQGVGANSIPGNTTAAVMVRNSVASDNSAGVEVQGVGILRVAYSVVTGNAVGVFTATTGTAFIYGDNDINGNGTDVSGTLTPVATR